MCNEVSGEVRDGGTVLQVHQVTGDILLRRRPARRDWITPARALTARVLLVLLLICAQQYAVTALGDSTFPDGAAIWPVGVEQKVIEELVAARIRQCTSEIVTTPVTCPQRGSVQRVHDVKWALLGDPKDGMWVVWHGDRFYVSGTAVMTLGYVTTGGYGNEVHALRFTAEVRWRGRETTEADLSLLPGLFSGLTRKSGFELTRDEVGLAIRRHLDDCTATTESPMAVECPRRRHAADQRGAVEAQQLPADQRAHRPGRRVRARPGDGDLLDHGVVLRLAQTRSRAAVHAERCLPGDADPPRQGHRPPAGDQARPLSDSQRSASR